MPVLTRRDMSKILTSPVKKWSGTIVIPDFLTIEQAMKWEESIEGARNLLPDVDFEYVDGHIDVSKLKPEHLEYFNVSHSLKYHNELVPGIKACVIEWHLENFDPENFPATPRQSRIDLINWIVSEITKLYKDAEEIPNA